MITLTISRSAASTHETIPWSGASLTAASADPDFPSAIFVMHMPPPPAEQRAIFSCVASLYQLELPVGAPSGTVPFFRSASCAFSAPNAATREAWLEDIKSDIAALLANWTATNTTESTEEIVIQ